MITVDYFPQLLIESLVQMPFILAQTHLLFSPDLFSAICCGCFISLTN